MRLDLYTSTNTVPATQVDAVAKAATTHKTQVQAPKAAPAPPATEDTTTLHSGTDSVASLTRSALEVSPTRAAKVAALKLAVSSAQYQLDVAQIAESLSSAQV